MKVILQADIKEHGKKGQLVEVSDGYARNFLFPRKLAVQATADNLNVMKQQAASKARKLELDKAEAREVAAKLEGVMVKVTAKAGDSGRLFGSITTAEISEALNAQHGIMIEKNKLVMDDNIKSFGTYSVRAKLGFEISGTVNVIVTEG